MKKLLLLLFITCFRASAANIDYRALLTNFFTTNNLYVGLNTNTNSSLYQFITNISIGTQLWATNAADGTITNINAYLGATVNGNLNVTTTNVVDSQVQITGSNSSKWVIKAVADTNSSSKSLIYSDAKGEHFVVTRNGNLSKILDVSYTWPASNGTAGQVFTTDGNTPEQIYFTDGSTTANFTNEIRSIVTNAGGIGPGTVNQVAKFVTVNNVGDSIISNPATNLVTIASRLDPNTWTNSVTVRVLGEYTNPTNYEGLELIAFGTHPANHSAIHGAFGTSSGVQSVAPLDVMDAWTFNSSTNTPSGTTAGLLFPIVDNTYGIGTTVNRVLSVKAGPAGYGASDAPTVNAADCNFSAATYGVNMSTVGIWMENKVSGFLTGFAKDANIGSGTYLGPNLLGAGASTTTLGWDTFITRGNEAHTWSFQTNSSNATQMPAAQLEGGEGSGTDKAGSDIRIAGGRGTGNGIPGNIYFATPNTNGGTGSAIQTLHDRMSIDTNGVVTVYSNLVVNGTGISSSFVAPRVVSVADATSFTPASATTDILITTNTQTAGTYTINNPSGTPVDGQPLMLRIKTTNIQTFSFGNQYRASTDLPLPVTSSGSSLTDYVLFRWNAPASKWDCVGKNFGF